MALRLELGLWASAGIGNVREGLHPVQERLAMAHGSQVPTPCAVCTSLQLICSMQHHQPISRTQMPICPQLCHELPSKMSAACTSLREWLRGAASRAVRLLHAWLCHVHVLPAALQARGAQRDRDRGGACRQSLVSLLMPPTPVQRHAPGVHMHEQESLHLYVSLAGYDMQS